MDESSPGLDKAEFFPVSAFTSNVLKLVGGTTLAQGVNAIAAPVLARIYSPHDFGIAAVFISIVSLLAVIACLRYEYAIVLPERDEDAVNVVALGIGVVLLLTGLTSLLFYYAQSPILDFLNATELRPFLWLIPVSLLINGVYLALTYWNTRTKHFTRLSITKVSASVTTNASQGIIASVAGPTAGGLISGSLAGFATAAAVLGGQIWRDDHNLFLRNVSIPKILEALKRYRKFPLVDSWGGFINSLSWQLPALLLSVFFSQAIVGYYAIAYRLVKLPMSLIGSSVGQVFFQKVSEVREDPVELAKVVEMVFQRLTSLGLFPAVLMTVAGRELFIVILGENWAEAGVFVQILGLWMFVWFVSSPLSTLFTVFEKQELALIVHSSILATRFISLLIGGLLNNVYIALGLFSGTGILVYGGLALWNMRLANVPFRSINRILLKYGLYASPLVGLVLLVKVLASSTPWWIVLVSGFVSIIYYLVVLGESFPLKANLFPVMIVRAERVRKFFRVHLDH